jgi:5'-3' exonuclease
MGVPGFFGWLVKILREFKKSGVLAENELNIIFDNLDPGLVVDDFYIDGNCLIHPVCFYTLARYQDDPRVVDPHFLHNKMFRNVFKYIKYLVSYVNPKRVYLSIDGVAPLAKINQQRKRRFMSIQEATVIDNIKKRYGYYKESIWNNTCISPGTEFMESLHRYLMKELPKLGKQVIYSSYHTPSEGEHKILQDIKLSNNDDIIRVIYGLDADLIFLALAAHKKNIYLLRESSQLDSKKKKTDDSMFEPLNYVSIDDLKQIINIKFKSDISRKLSNTTDLANLDSYDNSFLEECDFVNDFIFVCYLLGNDFLPHLPSIDIKINGLQLILNCYSEIFLKYRFQVLTVEGNNTHINNIFFLDLIRLIASYEKAHFTIFLPQYLEHLNTRSPTAANDSYNLELWRYNNVTEREDNFLGVGKKKIWKYDYYCKFFGIDGNQEEIINKACYKYLEGVAWTTKYYFDKCPSWDYQYDYNYCPFLSDISAYAKKISINMNSFKFNEQRANPIPIYAQLVAIMPPQRSILLPVSYRKLITHESPISDMYPLSVTIDTMNKEQRFKCVPNLPPVDINRIIKTIKNYELTKEEQTRCEMHGDTVFG